MLKYKKTHGTGINPDFPTAEEIGDVHNAIGEIVTPSTPLTVGSVFYRPNRSKVDGGDQDAATLEQPSTFTDG